MIHLRGSELDADGTERMVVSSGDQQLEDALILIQLCIGKAKLEYTFENGNGSFS